MHADENIHHFNEDSGNVAFDYNEMDILNIDLNIINLDNNFAEDDPDNAILIRLLTWHIKFEKRKEIKKHTSKKFRKREELIAIVWYSKRSWDWRMPEDEKKEVDQMFIEEL